MIKLINVVCVIVFFVLTLISCKKQEPKNPLVIEVDDKRVELVLENKVEYLVYDMPIKAKLIWENVDVNSGVFTGKGIRKLDFKNNETLIEINYTSDKSEKDTLEMTIKFKGINDTEYSQGIIKVPVRKNKN